MGVYTEDAVSAHYQDELTAGENKIGIRRVFGPAPWLKTSDKKHFRAKVSKSGNSLAVRIPAGTELSAGMEMDLTIEDGAYLSMQPIDPPNRKFNIAKVAGSAQPLNPIRDEDRRFEARALLWDGAATKP